MNAVDPLAGKIGERRQVLISRSYVPVFLGSAQAQSITIGETSALSSPGSGNGNLLAAQSATLAQAATIQSLCFAASPPPDGSLTSAFMTPPAPMAGPAR